MWVYLDSNEDITNFAFKINNGENTNQMIKSITLVAGTWTKISISKAEILAGAPSIDLTQARICIANVGSTYPNRANFYVDDFTLLSIVEQN